MRPIYDMHDLPYQNCVLKRNDGLARVSEVAV